MYSGITQGLFNVSRVEKKPGLINYVVTLNDKLLEGLVVGASINIDGVCQTVTEINGLEVNFTAMAETLRLTTLNDLFPGRLVSVERSIRYNDEIGGHEIAGHITGMATVSHRKTSENNLSLTLNCPPEWMKCILYKGFVAVDGSSLTVGSVDPAGFFDIHLIPETLRLTNFSNKKTGDRVNVELDRKTQVIVQTVERVLAQRSSS